MAGGNWSGAANWNPNNVPGSSDNVFITNNGIYTITLDVDATGSTLLLGANSGQQILTNASRSLNFANGATVANSGIFNWLGGTVSGPLTIASNGVLNLSGSDGKNLYNAPDQCRHGELAGRRFGAV